MVVDTLVGVFWGPRPRLTTVGPSISSDHGGFAESLTFVLKLLGFCNVVTRFILFGLAQRDDVRPAATFGVNQNYDLAVETPEGNQTLLVVTLANILTGNREVVPNGLAADEVQAMSFDIGVALSLVPRNHRHIVVTM